MTPSSGRTAEAVRFPEDRRKLDRPAGGERAARPSVTVIDGAPAYRRGVSSALADAGFAVQTVDDLLNWVAPAGRHAVVIWVRDDDHLDAVRTRLGGRPDLSIITLVPVASPAACRRAFRAGAAAAVSQDAELDEIAAAVTATTKGLAVVPRLVAEGVAEPADPPPAAVRISDAEICWLQRLAEGTSVLELAHESSYSERVMYRRLAVLYRRLGASGRTQALVSAARMGLIQ